MSEFQDFKRKFCNNRQWREFVSAVHESVSHPCAVTYPKVIGALRSGRDWFSDGAAATTRYFLLKIPPNDTVQPPGCAIKGTVNVEIS